MASLFDQIKKWMSYDAETEFYYKHNPSLAEQAEYLLRPMKKIDLGTVIDIERSAYEFPWEPPTFRDCLNVNYGCFVGEKAGRIVSYGIVSAGAGESHILNLCVAPHAQGRGYGRIMLEHLIEEARRRAAEVVFLEVRPSNHNAIKLYRALDFNEVGTRKGYYPARNGREDALVMARML
jgi:ribosomal-protein-alanine N-acetyltransferase